MRWFLATNINRRSVDACADNMLRDQYRPGRSWGFQLELRRQELLAGQYVEEYSTRFVATPPSGEPIIYNQTQYRITKFQLTTKPLQLELSVTPKKFVFFANKIAEYMDYNVSISVPKVDVLRWAGLLKERVPDAKIVKLWVNGIALSPTVSADLFLAGVEDVRPCLKKFSWASNAKVESLTLVTAEWTATLFSNCRATVSIDLEKAWSSLRHSLTAALE